MIGTSTAEYIWVRFWAVALHSIAPVCVGLFLATSLLPWSFRLPIYLHYWVIIETVFFLLTYVYQKYYLQRPALHPDLPSRDERNALFNLCQESVQDYGQYLSKWFLNTPLADIKLDNVKDFLRWAFLNTDNVDPCYDEELDGYVKRIETELGMTFEPGRNNHVKCLRLTLDKVDALHRSVTWYACIFVVDVLTHIYMRFSGFDFHRPSITRFIRVLPPRPHAMVDSHFSPAKDLTYWHHPHTSDTELPVLFLHGIGVGLWPYMQFLREINAGRPADRKIGVLAVEILSISSRISPPLLQRDIMCRQIKEILQHHGFHRFVLVSHSYGSVITTHLLKSQDFASQIASTILVDPISILLHQPDVAYNFTKRKPKGANEWLLWYFGSKDMGVAHTLSRTFFWSENILWKNDIVGRRVTIFLSSEDSIVNAPLVYAYLGDGSVKGQQSVKYGAEEIDRGQLSVVFCEDLDHGQIFDIKDWRRRLLDEVHAETLVHDT